VPTRRRAHGVLRARRRESRGAVSLRDGRATSAHGGEMGLRFFEAPPCRFPQSGANCSDVFQEVTGRALPAVALTFLISSAMLFTATIMLVATRLREPAPKAVLRKTIAAMLLVGSFSSVVATGKGTMFNPELSPSSLAVTFFATSMAGACAA
jgi:hypothetical protein